jgi:hypothetical protein
MQSEFIYLPFLIESQIKASFRRMFSHYEAEIEGINLKIPS